MIKGIWKVEVLLLQTLPVLESSWVLLLLSEKGGTSSPKAACNSCIEILPLLLFFKHII